MKLIETVWPVLLGSIQLLKLMDSVNAGVIIYHKDNGRFNDGGYTARILPNDQILTEIAKHRGVWYDRGKLRTKSDRDREYYNLVQAILEANAYKEFAKWGWTKC